MLSLRHRETSCESLYFPAPLRHAPCPGTGKLPGSASTSLTFPSHSLNPAQGSFLVRPPLPCLPVTLPQPGTGKLPGSASTSLLPRHTPSTRHREASWFGLHFPAPLRHAPCPSTGKKGKSQFLSELALNLYCCSILLNPYGAGVSFISGLGCSPVGRIGSGSWPPSPP